MNGFSFLGMILFAGLGFLLIATQRHRSQKKEIDRSAFADDEEPAQIQEPDPKPEAVRSEPHAVSEAPPMPEINQPEINQPEINQPEANDAALNAVLATSLEATPEAASDLTATSEPQAEVPDVALPDVEAEVTPAQSQLEAAPALPPLIPLQKSWTDFNAAFQHAFVQNLQQQGQSPQTATVQDQYRLLVTMVRDYLQQVTAVPSPSRTPSRTVVELAMHLTVSTPLETSLNNLDILNDLYEAFQALGLNLTSVLNVENQQSQPEMERSELLGGYLEALATANIPAIGYSLYTDASTQPTAFWEIKRSDHKLSVGFGGYTQNHLEDAEYRIRWLPEQRVEAVPVDLLIPGYEVNRVSVLRQWQAELVAPMVSPQTVSPPMVSPPMVSPQTCEATVEQKELGLKRQFLLVSCAIQDVIRRHLQSGEPITTLPERFSLQIQGCEPALAIAELMHRFVDEHRLDWAVAWSMTQQCCACTLDSLCSIAEEQWSINMLGRLLPRHLEILYEINRQFLDQVRLQHPGDIEFIRKLSLINEADYRTLRTLHLVGLGAHSVSSISTPQTHQLQTLFSDLNQYRSAPCRTVFQGINLRRYLLQSNPRLANLLLKWIDADWINRPNQLAQLKNFVNNDQFCADWWQTKRENKQALATLLSNQTGLSVNASTLFDIQIAPVQTRQRQLLNLLHIITLYVRLKLNADTDTIQRFAHRSIPRTCILTSQLQSQNQIDDLIHQLLQAVAATINHDTDMQGRLQIILSDCNPKQLKSIYAGADLSEQLTSVLQENLGLEALRCGLNGVAMIGTQTPIYLEMHQMGVQNSFLFGLTPTAARQLIHTGYDPQAYYRANAEFQQVIELISSGYFSHRNRETFRPLVDWLMSDQAHLILADYPSYLDCQERISQTYQDQKTWTRLAISTLAQMDTFSADRTILNYQAG